MTWNSWSSCLHPPSTGITGVSYHALYTVLGMEPMTLYMLGEYSTNKATP